RVHPTPLASLATLPPSGEGGLRRYRRQTDSFFLRRDAHSQRYAGPCCFAWARGFARLPLFFRPPHEGRWRAEQALPVTRAVSDWLRTVVDAHRRRCAPRLSARHTRHLRPFAYERVSDRGRL